MAEKTIPEQIKEQMERIGISQSELARLVGRDPSVINKVLNGKRKLSAEEHARIVGILMGASEVHPDALNARLGRPLTFARPAGDLVGARDLPVYAAAQGGQGHMLVTFEPIDWVKRPFFLEGAKGAYSILITGESMIPVFEPGDMALVRNQLPSSPEADVILYGAEPQGEVEAMVKRAIRWNDKTWTLRQWNPKKDFTEHRADWPIAHWVVGKYNARR